MLYIDTTHRSTSSKSEQSLLHLWILFDSVESPFFPCLLLLKYANYPKCKRKDASYFLRLDLLLPFLFSNLFPSSIYVWCYFTFWAPLIVGTRRVELLGAEYDASASFCETIHRRNIPFPFLMHQDEEGILLGSSGGTQTNNLSSLTIVTGMVIYQQQVGLKTTSSLLLSSLYILECHHQT